MSKHTCPVCKEEYNWPYTDASDSGRKIPPTCGKRPCVTNWEYRKLTRNMRTGEYRDIDDIGKI